MMKEIADLISNYGMSGVCIVLFGIVTWLIRVLISIQKDTSDAYKKNTEAYTKNTDTLASLEKTIQEDTRETRKLSEMLITHIAKDH